MTKRASVLLLVLNCFSSTGGIQKACRTLAYTLHSISEKTGNSFKMQALYDTETNEKYLPVSEFSGCSGNLISFIHKSAVAGSKSRIVIISHINLLSIAIFIKIFNPGVIIILMAHGKEIWDKLHPWKLRFIKKYATIWAVSAFTRDVLKNKHQCYPGKIIRLNNCLDPFFNVPGTFDKPPELLQRYQLSPQQPVLLSICRLTKNEHQKGYDKIINIIPELLPMFPYLHYLICGETDYNEKTRLQNLIRQHKLQKNISLVNFIPETELTPHYLLADVFILPSKKEGFGLVFIEAAACGCKIISGNADGSKDAMLNGKLGTMIDPDDPAAIKKSIIENLSRERSPAAALTIQKNCLMYFSQQRYQQQIENILQYYI